jgi:hypothetical protein
MSYNPESYPVYPKCLPSYFVAQEKHRLCTFINTKVAPSLKINFSDLAQEDDLIYDIIDMVQRRKVYFHVFHNGMELGELNEGCLWTFWVLKFCPFRDKTGKLSSINVKIALSIFVLTVSAYAKVVSKKVAVMTPKRAEYLAHAFKYRDISKEALMAIAESLIE